jgi:hypothetical protein
MSTSLEKAKDLVTKIKEFGTKLREKAIQERNLSLLFIAENALKDFFYPEWYAYIYDMGESYNLENYTLEHLSGEGYNLTSSEASTAKKLYESVQFMELGNTKVKLVITKIDYDQDYPYRLLAVFLPNTQIIDPNWRELKDWPDYLKSKTSEVIYFAPKQGCTWRACNLLFGDITDSQISFSIDFTSYYDLIGRVSKGEVGQINFTGTTKTEAVDYVLAGLTGIFDGVSYDRLPIKILEK